MALPKRFLDTGVFTEGLEAFLPTGVGLVLPGLVLPEDFRLVLGFGGIKDSEDFLRILEFLGHGLVGLVPKLVFPLEFEYPVGLSDDPNTMLFALGDPVKTLN